MKGLKIPVILFVFVGVLALALVGDHLLHGRRVVTPLVNELNAVPGVAQAWLEGRGKKAQVYVVPTGEMDLVSLYPELSARLEEHLGAGTSDRLHLVDVRTPFLEQVYQQMRFSIEEAIATGHFRQLPEDLRVIADSLSVNHRVQIDSQNVYLQLLDGEAHLYAIIDRSRSMPGMIQS